MKNTGRTRAEPLINLYLRSPPQPSPRPSFAATFALARSRLSAHLPFARPHHHSHPLARRLVDESLIKAARYHLPSRPPLADRVAPRRPPSG